jgi:ribosomal protein S18 acetylase RimI-like enzyme
MIRLATIQDASRIAEIEVSSCRFAYGNIVSEEILFKDMLVEKRIQHVKNWILGNNDFDYVFEDVKSKIIKGMMGIGKSEDSDKKDAFELHFIYIEPFYFRNGIGSLMLTFYEERGIELRYKEFVIWVLQDNKIGINFYEKNKYTHDGNTKIFKRFIKMEIRYIKKLA